MSGAAQPRWKRKIIIIILQKWNEKNKMHTKLFLQFGLVFGHLPLLAIILGDEGVSATFKRQRKLTGESFWRTIAAFFDFLISKRNRLDRQSGDGQGYSCFFFVFLYVCFLLFILFYFFVQRVNCSRLNRTATIVIM